MQTKLKLKTKNQRADEPRLCYNDNYYIYIYHTLSTYTYIYISIYGNAYMLNIIYTLYCIIPTSPHKMSSP